MRQRRHSSLEIAVYAAALLLSAFIAREVWRRRPAGSSARSVGQAADRTVGEEMPLPKSFGQAAPPHRTEQAVTGVAPIKLTRIRRRKSRPDAVPAPR